MNNKKKIILLIASFFSAVLLVSLTYMHTIKGADVGGTEGLFSYSRITNGELHYPSTYLLAGEFSRGANGDCTAVNGLTTKAYGWPFFYAVDDPNCGSKNILPLPFLLDVLCFWVVLVAPLPFIWRTK